MSVETDHEADESETFAIDASGETTLPVVDVLTGRSFVTGKSGSGKSNSVSVVAEELLKRSHPLMIVDTDGEYYGLKEQYEVLHVGADEECAFAQWLAVGLLAMIGVLTIHIVLIEVRTNGAITALEPPRDFEADENQ